MSALQQILAEGKTYPGKIDLHGAALPDPMPERISCYELDLSHTEIEHLPEELDVAFRINLEGCWRLETLPEGLHTGSLILRDCSALRALPEGLQVYFLDISGCTNLIGWPQEASVEVGRFVARGCSQIRALPAWLNNIAELDISGCANLKELPEDLIVTGWIDVADSGVTALPEGLRGVQLRWRGVEISERIAFHPEMLTAEEILEERNAERRRVMLERMGHDAFLEEANAEALYEDEDPGGVRQLLRVAMAGDEPLVVLAVRCPSTGRQYVIRVPPSMETCHQAAAWIAGFDNPDDYQPIAET